MKRVNSKISGLLLGVSLLTSLFTFGNIQGPDLYIEPVRSYNPVSLDLDELRHEEKPQVELVFALDATGSMSGLIQTAKNKIWSIASSMASAQPAPDLKIGMVFYRDRGDAFVTKQVDLSHDIDAVYEKLLGIAADGGGDTPESVNQALHEAVNKLSWNLEPNVYRVMFLVGDCPPHMDYAQDVKYQKTCAVAKKKDIVINTIQLGNCAGTQPIWQEIARLTGGEYFRLNQGADGLAISTPYDKEIGEVSKKMESTKIYYGDKKIREEQNARKERSGSLDGKYFR